MRFSFAYRRTHERQYSPILSLHRPSAGQFQNTFATIDNTFDEQGFSTEPRPSKTNCGARYFRFNGVTPGKNRLTKHFSNNLCLS